MAERMAESRAQHDEESRQERVNRELIELLNELRVALPGVQVLFAFLLTVPFSNGYKRITPFQKNVYFAVLVATAISTACFIVPTAYHRLNFRKREKERILLSSNKFSIAGIMFLAASMVGVLVLITDVIYSEAAAVVAGHACSSGVNGIPTPSATAGCVTAPPATFTPSRNPGSWATAPRGPSSASASTYGSVAFVSA